MRALASRRVNTDPKPYYVAELADSTHDGRVAKSSVDFSSTEYDGEGGTLYHLAKFAPRPEFNNNPNPILERVRATGYDPGLALDDLDDLDVRFDQEHIDHARKVLTRIADMRNNHAE